MDHHLLPLYIKEVKIWKSFILIKFYSASQRSQNIVDKLSFS